MKYYKSLLKAVLTIRNLIIKKIKLIEMQCIMIFTLLNFEALLGPLQIIRTRYSDNKSVKKHKLFLLNLFLKKVMLIISTVFKILIFFNIGETESSCTKH